MFLYEMAVAYHFGDQSDMDPGGGGGGGGGGHSGTEGGRTFVTYFAEEGVFF